MNIIKNKNGYFIFIYFLFLEDFWILLLNYIVKFVTYAMF